MRINQQKQHAPELLRQHMIGPVKRITTLANRLHHLDRSGIVFHTILLVYTVNTGNVYS